MLCPACCEELETEFINGIRFYFCAACPFVGLDFDKNIDYVDIIEGLYYNNRD